MDIRPINSASQTFAPLATTRPHFQQPMLASTIEFGETNTKEKSIWELSKALLVTIVEVFTRFLPSLMGLCTPKHFELPAPTPPTLSKERIHSLAEHFGDTTPSQKQIQLLNIFLAYHDLFAGKEFPADSSSHITIEGGPAMFYLCGSDKTQRARALAKFVQFLKESSTAALNNVQVRINTRYKIYPWFGPILSGITSRKEQWKTQYFRFGAMRPAKRFFTIEREESSKTALTYPTTISAEEGRNGHPVFDEI